DGLGGHKQERPVNQPFVVEEAAIHVSSLKRIAPQVIDLGYTHGDEGLAPDTETMRPLLLESALPLIDTNCHQVAVIAPVDETATRVLLYLAFQERQQVVAVKVDFESLFAGLITLLNLLHDVRLASRGHERGQHVDMREELIGNRARLDD